MCQPRNRSNPVPKRSNASSSAATITVVTAATAAAVAACVLLGGAQKWAVTVAAVGLSFAVLLWLRGGAAKQRNLLNRERQHLTLERKEIVSHDTIRLVLRVPQRAKFELPVGLHVKLFTPNSRGHVQGQWNGREDKEAARQEIERKYTPVSSNREHVELMLKVYRGGVVDRFPDGGKMSQQLDRLQVGDTVALSGPWGVHEYIAPGMFKSGPKQVNVKNIGMIAGGTGITPMLQIADAILDNPQDETTISLLFANQTEEDILLRPYLDHLAAVHPQQFKIWYTVDRAPAKWAYSEGFVDAAMISEHLPPPAEDTVIFMCGPPPMIEFACKKNLDALGYAKGCQFAW